MDKKTAFNILKIISSSLAGTSIMTLFSYYRDKKLNRLFKEPVLLNKLIYRSRLPKSGQQSFPAPGWLVHYLIGAIFSAVYHKVWKSTPTEPSVLSGSLLGLMSGIVGDAGWKLMLRTHDNPPAFNSLRFYLHLIPAHIVFALATTAVYNLEERIKQQGK